MDQGLIPRRYAKALYEYAAERHQAADIYTMMQNVAAAFVAQPALQSTVANPFVASDDKYRLVMTAAGLNDGKQTDNADPDILVRFVKLLVKNHRIDLIRLIAIAYVDIYRQTNRIFGVRITSAAPLDDADSMRIRQMVDKHLGNATAEYTFSVDPSLIGGFVVTINSARLDASVKNELQQLGRSLASA